MQQLVPSLEQLQGRAHIDKGDPPALLCLKNTALAYMLKEMQYATPFHGFPKSALIDIDCRSRIISLFLSKSALLWDLSPRPKPL